MERAEFFSSQAGRTIIAPRQTRARFGIGDVVRHRLFAFRGVVFDIDPVFANSEEWYQSIPEEIRPPRDQPFYHLLAENEDSSYVAYVSQGNLIADPEGGPVDHPTVRQLFDSFKDGRYRMRNTGMTVLAFQLPPAPQQGIDACGQRGVQHRQPPSRQHQRGAGPHIARSEKAVAEA